MEHAAAFDDACKLLKETEHAALRRTCLRNLILLGGREHPQKTMEAAWTALVDADAQIQMEALNMLGFFQEGLPEGPLKKVAELAAQPDKHDGSPPVARTAKILLEQWAALKKLPKPEDVVSKPNE